MNFLYIHFMFFNKNLSQLSFFHSSGVLLLVVLFPVVPVLLFVFVQTVDQCKKSPNFHNSRYSLHCQRILFFSPPLTTTKKFFICLTSLFCFPHYKYYQSQRFYTYYFQLFSFSLFCNSYNTVRLSKS